MRDLAVQNAKSLEKGNWAMAYANFDYDNCNNVLSALQSAGNKIGIKVDEPEWIELDKNFSAADLDRLLAQVKKTETNVKIVVLLVPNENLYQDAKKVCYKHGCVSQCIKKHTYNSMRDEKKARNIGCNILKQINSKLGGDLFYLKFPEEVTKRKVMLLGIDVCHSGNVSNVGFCASVNKEMSQYYSQRLIQQRNQEIVDSNLKEALKNALEAFAENNKTYPEHFILYRDGVGDAMRMMVIQQEVSQL